MPTGGRRVKIPGMQLIKKAESKGNEVEVPVAENLGLIDFVKLTYEEMSEDHVRGRGGQALLEGLRAFDLHVARGGHSPDRRTRARRLRRVYRCDRGRPCRARIHPRHNLEHSAVASRGPSRSVRLRPDLLLRTRRQTEVPLDQPRLGPGLRLLAHLFAAVLAVREHLRWQL